MKLLLDENFDGDILRGLLRRKNDLIYVRVQDFMQGVPDTEVLAWAAQEGYIVLTHNIQTMAGFAYARIEQGLPMPGLIEIDASYALGRIVDDLMLFIEASEANEWESQIIYLPLR